MMLITAVVVLAVLAASSTVSARLTFNQDGTFKILHLSDVHYRIGPDQPSRDVTEAQAEYSVDGAHNTTDFIKRLIELEKPDLVVHTGDIIDGDTHTPSQGMEDLYGVSFGAGIPWAATIGNHDDNGDITREELMDYILTLPLGVSKLNALGEGETESFGNFYLEIFESEHVTTPSFRTFHLDANTNNVSINADQVSWFTSKATELSAVSAAPALAFFHIPLEEYKDAVRTKDQEICGMLHEHVSYNGQSGLFDAIKQEGSVKATFVGHDHTNDFCTLYQGVQLCYEGSPGYQGYGNCEGKHRCLERRARVTNIVNWGKQVRSWKRMATDNYPETAVIDQETLWAAEGEVPIANKNDCSRVYTAMSDEQYARLSNPRKKHYEECPKA